VDACSIVMLLLLGVMVFWGNIIFRVKTAAGT